MLVLEWQQAKHTCLMMSLVSASPPPAIVLPVLLVIDGNVVFGYQALFIMLQPGI